MSERSLIKRNLIQHQSKTLSNILGSMALVVGLLLMTAAPVMALEETQYSDVFINGYKLGFFEQIALENHLNREIPDGNYWFELDTGMWGPVGGTAFGRIEVSEDYRDFVNSKFSNKQNQATQVELSASAEGCKNDCMYW